MERPCPRFDLAYALASLRILEQAESAGGDNGLPRSRPPGSKRHYSSFRPCGIPFCSTGVVLRWQGRYPYIVALMHLSASGDLVFICTGILIGAELAP